MNTPGEPHNPAHVSPAEPSGPRLEPPSPAGIAGTLQPWEIWTLRDLLWFLAFIPFALVASKLVVLLGYVVLGPWVGWHLRPDQAQQEIIFLLTEQSFFYVFLVVFLFLMARIAHGQHFWRSLGWRKPPARQVAIYLLAGAAMAVAVTVLLSLLPDKASFPLEKLFNSTAASYAIGGFAIAFAPVVEELVFRGILFAVFERSVGMRFAVLLTAGLFAGLHVPEYWHAWNHMFLILVVGLVFSLARGLTGSLAPSILLHIGYNAFIMGGLFVSTQHFRVPGGGVH